MPRDLSNPILSNVARLQGAEIRRGRQRYGWSQAQAAEAIGVAKMTYLAWEHGKRSAPEAIRERLAGLWGLDRGLLGLDPENTCPCCGRDYD